MAAAKMPAPPAGSPSWMEWVGAERREASELIEQEMIDFSYSVRNEVEWLNEHMGDIFNADHVNLADMFKTPGKLRGKTPRTARKRDALAARPPLTDMFAPNAHVTAQPLQRNGFLDKVAHFNIAEDAENARPSRRSKSPQRVGKSGNTDSGYHGMTEDEMDVEVDAKTETATDSSQDSHVQTVPLRELLPVSEDIVGQGTSDGGRASDESFISAKDEIARRSSSDDQLEVQRGQQSALVPEMTMRNAQQEVNETPAADGLNAIHGESRPPMPPSAPSSMDVPSPQQPLQRKSSFAFAALPARELMAAKGSIGARNSHIDVRNSLLARSISGKNVEIPHDFDEEDAQQRPEEAKAYSKSSTQLLHERITLLGKPKEPRISKSIPHMALQAPYPQLPPIEAGMVARNRDGKTIVAVDDVDDDWIAPSRAVPAARKPSIEPAAMDDRAPIRPMMHQKSISTTIIPSPSRDMIEAASRPQRAISVSNLSLAHAAGVLQSSTPAGSPAHKKSHEGPISASKNRLWSALKSAKNIFASSASASAAAKLEAHNNGSPGLKRDAHDQVKMAALFNMPGAMYSERQLSQSPSRPISSLSASPSKTTLRDSSESDKKREKEAKAQQKAADELEKAREKERVKAAKQLAERTVSAAPSVEKALPPSAPRSMLPAGKLRAPGRPLRPNREQPASTRPAPVSIRVASQSQRLHQAQPSQSTLSKATRDSQAPPPPPKTGLRTASAQGSVRSSTAPNNARLKALEAAARRKEADDKAAEKKLEQKRELERKRAAKVEEERRAEEDRKAVELARIQEAKIAAQRKADQQAIGGKKREQHRLDQQRLQDQLAEEARKREQQRFELQRQHEEAQKAKAAHELAEMINRERTAQPHARGDIAGGTLRQLTSRSNMIEQGAAPRPPMPINTAKPAAKRALHAEDDEQQDAVALQRSEVRTGPPYHQEGLKRRRTNEQNEDEDGRRSVMAPPKRPSGMRKESTQVKFSSHGYAHAPPPAAHHPASMSMFKATLTAQHQLQHPPPSQHARPVHPSQTVQVSSARIPFAESNGNRNAGNAHQQGVQQSYKTPARPAHDSNKSASAKSSPMYPKGDAIELPEIATDSEDEDADSETETGAFRAPSWVASPALRDLLTQQQLVDPESVFGPIGELRMEEVFKGGKHNADRMKRFRDRGSSAAWIESGDAVTSAEKRRDKEGRERMVTEGGWRFEGPRS